MKILVVSNLYPPHHQGGYELRCQQVTDTCAPRGTTSASRPVRTTSAAALMA